MSETDDEAPSESEDWPVTKELILNIIKNKHKDLFEPDIQDYNMKAGCDPGESVLSNIIAVCVGYNLKNLENDTSTTDHSLNFIIKLLPQDPFSRFFVTEAQFDLREIKFYTEVIPDLETFKKENLVGNDDFQIPIPKCYYGHYMENNDELDPDLPESVLALENMKSQGYISSDFSRGLTLRQTKAAIESIAQIHALSLSYKVKKEENTTEKYPFLFQTTRASDSYQQLLERGLPQLSKFLETRPGLTDILAALNELKPHTKNIIECLLTPEEPMALITHTDFWCNNLMFKEDETNCQCCILDWQMVTYSRATNDLALLLISSVPAELRRLHTNKLLDSYWEILIKTCKRLGTEVENTLKYDRKKLGEDYKRSQLLALLLCIGSVDLALGNAEMEERLVEILQDLHSDGLLRADAMKKEK